MRDIDEKPYSPDEMRVAEFFASKGAGGGDDPIAFMLCSYEWLVEERKTLRAALDQAKAEKAELQNRFSEGRTQLMAEIAKARAAMCQKALYKSERDALRAELNDKSNQIVELQTELERCFNLEAELDAAEAESDRLRAAYNDVRALNAQITLNFGAELAAVRLEANELAAENYRFEEALKNIAADVAANREPTTLALIARTALQSHRRTEEAT